LPHDRRPAEQLGGFFAGYCGIGTTSTSDDGIFVITGLKAGRPHRISALADGRGEGVADRVASTTLAHLPPADALTIGLGSPHHLKVRVVRAGEQNVGVPKARVTLVDGNLDLDHQFSWGYHDVSWEDMTRGRTDAWGWVDFPELACGEATVLVQAVGFGRKRLSWRDGRDKLIFPLEREAALGGQVRDASGVPLKDAYITLAGLSGDRFITTIAADGQGTFRLDELPREKKERTRTALGQ
jgi:hypothetical protein